MAHVSGRSVKMRSMLSVGLMITSIVLTSCYQTHGVLREQVISGSYESEIKSTLVFFIHGDGSYDYHDQEGKRFEADKVILQQATALARSSAHSEVFIFHQKPKRKWLFFIDRPDGAFYYFRGGAQLASGSYHRRTDVSALDSESEIFKAYLAPHFDERMSGFLYFGHSLAEVDNKWSPSSVSVRRLAQGMSLFLAEGDPQLMKFDLVVLSACYSGTPGIVTELAPYCRYILASPEDLHLAYMDIQPLRRLDANDFSDVRSLAREMASLSLTRLQKYTQTSIALAVYDIERIAPVLQKTQDRRLSLLPPPSQNSHRPVPMEYYDCAEGSSADADIPSAGVEVYYQPPRFGRLKNKSHHSGWACWQVISR